MSFIQVEKYCNLESRIMEQTRVFSLAKIFKKQIKTNEDQGIKQVEA